MLVLDHPRTTTLDEPEIVVPPFHTGHLGFVPGTDVHVRMLAVRQPRGAADRHVRSSPHREIVVTPFSQEFDQLVLLTATMHEDIGVVKRLIGAVAAHGINIEVQESSSINHLNQHHVSLLLNLAESNFDPVEGVTAAAIPRLYAEYTTLLPIAEQRFVQLFDSVVRECLDILVFDEVSGLPALTIQPLPGREFTERASQTIERVGDDRAYHVRIPLPEAIRARLRRAPEFADLETVRYLFVSDTAERSLRAIFMTAEVADKLVHVAFYHEDRPRALATILNLIGAADFNILTSLVRKHKGMNSVWEAVLQYKGRDDSIPLREEGKAYDRWMNDDVYPWVRQKILDNEEQAQRLAACEIQLGLPLYPRMGERNEDGTPKHLVPLSEVLPKREVTIPDIAPSGEVFEALRMRLENRDPAPSGPELKAADRLIDLVRRRTDRRSMIFLSCPASAYSHADLVRAALENTNEFVVVDYRELTGSGIAGDVMQRIHECDGFVGIWHHEDRSPLPDGKFGLSPWMYFEYGVALAADKGTMVVRSEKLADHVWNRIRGDDGRPPYSDLTFRSETVPTIVKYCRENMR